MSMLSLCVYYDLYVPKSLQLTESTFGNAFFVVQNLSAASNFFTSICKFEVWRLPFDKEKM